MDRINKITDYVLDRETQAVTYHKLSFGDVFWFTSLFGSVFGILLNALLIAAIYKNGFRLLYGRLFFSAAVFDLFFSVVEILTQHQIAVKNGVMFLFPRGIEWWFYDWFAINHLIFVVHCFAYMQGIFMLAPLFRYRYLLGQEGSASVFRLIDGLVVTSAGAFIAAVSATVGVHQAGKRGWNYYLSMIQREYNTKYFMYAIDIRDAGTIVYFVGGMLIATIAFGIATFYARKSFNQPKIEDAKGRVLQAQLTQGLVLRTLTTIVFGVLSVLLAEICVVFRFDAEIFGTSMTLKMKDQQQLASFTPSPNVSKLLNIQGLRGLAILSVLFYHLRPDICPNGFLGVDLFFAISGFLMYRILHTKLPLDFPKMSAFYFRRFRRIIPPYLFVIFCTLFLSVFVFLHQMDFAYLFDEVWRPLLFLANWPAPDQMDYSKRESNNFPFFKHLWSLSVELQFYLLVPFLFILFDFVGKIFELAVILVLAVLSLLFQFQSMGNQEHMFLFGRIWQFLFGFLAFKLFKFFCDKSTKNRFLKWANVAFIHLLTLLLVVALIFPIFVDRKWNRLMIMIIGVILKASTSTNHILSNLLLVELGNISYSVYLVHWPLMQWNAYWYFADYLWTGGLPQAVATILLVTASLLIGWLLENGYAKISVYLTNWTRLLFMLFGLYWLVAEGMLYLKLNEGDINLKSLLLHTPPPLNNSKQLVDDLTKMWKDELDHRLNKSQAIYYNQHFYGFAWDLNTCPDQRRTSIPTQLDLKNLIGFGNTKDHVVGITGSCVVRGNGTKNIVLFGNSHAQAAFFGIEREFRGVYKHLTLFSAGACFLIRWRGRIATPTKATYEGCLRVIKHLYEILRHWNHPIDVIMMVHAYLYSPEVLYFPVDNLDADPEYLELNQLFQKLSTIARDVVMVPQLHFETGLVSHMNVLYRRILSGRHLKMFQIEYESQHRRAEPIRKRIEKAAKNCWKCVLLEWEEVWCDRRKGGLCNSIDQQRGLSYFFDLTHVNTYGSLFVGRYVRQKYDEWLGKNQTTLIQNFTHV